MALVRFKPLKTFPLLSRHLRLLGLGVYVAFSLTACPSTKKTDTALPTSSSQQPLASDGTSRTGGGQDGGGGAIADSTPEQVIEALEAARKFLSSSSSGPFLQDAIQSAEQWSALPAEYVKKVTFPKGLSKTMNFKKVAEVLSKIKNPSLTSDAKKESSSYTTVADYLKLSPVRYEKNDTPEKNCSKAGYNTYPDAFVDGFDYGSEICFNIQKLTRIPKDGLKQHALALWLHELSHLNGLKDETIANDVENFLLWSTHAEIQGNLESLAEALVQKSMGVYNAVDTLHELHVRHESTADSEVKGGNLQTVTTFEGDAGIIQGKLEVLETSLEALVNLQKGFIFHHAYASISSEIEHFKKLHLKLQTRFKTLMSESDPTLGSPEEIEKAKVQWDQFWILSFCVAASSHKVTTVSSLSGSGSPSYGLKIAKQDHDIKQCEQFDDEK